MKRSIISTMLILLLCSAACTNTSAQAGSTMHSGNTPTALTPNSTLASMLAFTAKGGLNGTFVLRANSTISMLRHGHKEFTIDLVDGSETVFLVFYGYIGPGSYHLSNPTNGGDVHISFGTAQTTWDLTATPGAFCDLSITSDQPSQYTGIDSMQGTFDCPQLAPVNSNQHISPLTISKGKIDILILVAS